MSLEYILYKLGLSVFVFKNLFLVLSLRYCSAFSYGSLCLSNLNEFLNRKIHEEQKHFQHTKDKESGIRSLLQQSGLGSSRLKCT